MALFIGGSLLLTAVVGSAADLGSATVTQIVRDVKLLPPNSDAVPASVGAKFSGTTAIATGRRSRAELEFSDATLMRIGSSTVFSISGGRSVDLQRGALLLQTPHNRDGSAERGNNRGVRIRAGGVTAAITGSMGLVSLSEPTDEPHKGEELFFKFIAVHGTMRLELKGKIYELRPFQLLFLRLNLQGEVIGEPVIQTIDGERLLASSLLIKGFDEQTRLAQQPIDDNTDMQGIQKGDNEWTAVNSGAHDRVPGLLRRGVIGINSLIRPQSPPVVMMPPPAPKPEPRPAPLPTAPAPVVTPVVTPVPATPAPATPAPVQPDITPPIETGTTTPTST